MPRISAATPRLFRKVRSRTPKALMIVDTSIAMTARNDHVFRNGMGLAAARSMPNRGDRTSGTVAATAVTVRTPAQK